MKPETKFRVNQVDPFLKKLRATRPFSIQQLSLVGDPDKLVCIRGYFVALELKREEGEATPLQRKTLLEVRKAGGIGLVVKPSNWSGVKALLQRLSLGDYDDVYKHQNQVQGNQLV